MESSPAATMAPPSASSSRSRDPLLLSSFDLPAGWGCRRPMAFCRDIDAHVVTEPDAAATVPQNNAPGSPAKGAVAAQLAPAAEEAQEAPRRQWNLRDRTGWRDYRVEDARQHKKLGNMEAGGKKSRGLSVPLTRQEIDADFVAITGQKPPRRPKKRAKNVQRQIEMLSHGSLLSEVTRDRYKVNEVCIKTPSLVSPESALEPWRFETLIGSTLIWCRKGDSELHKHSGGDGFPTEELDRALAGSSELLRERFRVNRFSLWLFIQSTMCVKP
ncbi:uncharacterized protein LOC133929899 [Phragmites australis]|uniref:uncharacterized protein LOC133929899 n=1 Tax=Phragmites australis TaxID=29695 RepID=UPI002D76B40A|nr:uncharacterized protein LOC133929899 [Phragmites australis]